MLTALVALLAVLFGPSAQDIAHPAAAAAAAAAVRSVRADGGRHAAGGAVGAARAETGRLDDRWHSGGRGGRLARGEAVSADGGHHITGRQHAVAAHTPRDRPAPAAVLPAWTAHGPRRAGARAPLAGHRSTVARPADRHRMRAPPAPSGT